MTIIIARTVCFLYAAYVVGFVVVYGGLAFSDDMDWIIGNETRAELRTKSDQHLREWRKRALWWPWFLTRPW